MSETTPGRRRGLLLAVASAASFGFAGPFSKAVLAPGGLSALRLAQLRITGAAVILLVVVAVRRARAVTAPHPWNRVDVALVALYGALGFVAVQVCYFVAINRLPVGVALLFEYLSVVLVALFAAVAQRRAQPRAVWAGVALVLTGLVVMTQPWHAFALNRVGALAGCGAAVGSASYFLLGEHATARIPTLELIAFGAAAAAVMLGVALPWWTFPFSRLSRSASFAHHHVPIGLLAAVVIVIGTVLAYLWGLRALHYLPAPTATVLATLEIIVAAAAAWALLGEHLSGSESGGGAVIFAGVALVGYRSRLGPAGAFSGTGSGPQPPG